MAVEEIRSGRRERTSSWRRKEARCEEKPTGSALYHWTEKGGAMSAMGSP